MATSTSIKQVSWNGQRSRIILALFLWLGCSMDSTMAGWVDPDTPAIFHATESFTDTRPYGLVFSDEFEQSGRRFHDGSDPRWTAISKNDYTNLALHYYSSDNAFTSNGVLNITTELKENTYKAFNETTKQFFADKKYVQSGMLQSWNKFCFVGGIVEISAKLPGDPKVGGLWPALWMLGNLARATYIGSSNYIWPYSYNVCDTRNRKSQLINACAQVNHFGLDPFRGRGSPEIDILESMQGEAGKLPSTFIERPYQSTSLQIAPGIEIDRPTLGKRPHMSHWYEGVEYSAQNISDLNPFFYGVAMKHAQKDHEYQSDALSANTQLNTTHYEKQHLYRMEWEPPAANGTGGFIKWYTDGSLVYSIHGQSLEIMKTEIPSEPMYLIMNTAVASSWGFPSPCPANCDCSCFQCGNPSCACALPAGYCDNFPASFEIDYVRVYQAMDDEKHILGCSPEHRPTEQFIAGHAQNYMAEGDRRPLETVQRGGGQCKSSKDCGISNKTGTCLSSGMCKCTPEFTGPNCLAHAGAYDFPTHKESLLFSEMVLPRSMIFVLCTLAFGFLYAMFRTHSTNAKMSKYRAISEARLSNSRDSGSEVKGSTTISSYQDSAAVHYALSPDKFKDRTYCVIDGRLVDER